MNQKEISIIILAAGKGTRLQIDIPKAIVKIGGIPMIVSLLNNLRKINQQHFKLNYIVVVSESNKESIKETIDKYGFSKNTQYVVQEEQLGTAHAVKTALEKMDNKTITKDIIVLVADQPFVSDSTILNLIQLHKKLESLITIGTLNLDGFQDKNIHFYHHGRIIRNEKREIIDIKEKNELTEEELNKLTEVNPSIYIFDTNWIKENIQKIEINAEKKEYYLTHIVKIAVNQNIKVHNINVSFEDGFGINTPEQLKEAENMLILHNEQQ